MLSALHAYGSVAMNLPT